MKAKQRPCLDRDAGPRITNHARTLSSKAKTWTKAVDRARSAMAEPTVAGQRRTLTGFPYYALLGTFAPLEFWPAPPQATLTAFDHSTGRVVKLRSKPSQEIGEHKGDVRVFGRQNSPAAGPVLQGVDGSNVIQWICNVLSIFRYMRSSKPHVH